MLQRLPHVTKSRDIRPLLAARLAQWESGDYSALVDQAVHAMQLYLATRRGIFTDAQIERHFQTLMLKGEIRRAHRYLAERCKFAVHQPHDIVDNGQTASAIMQSKHPLPTAITAAQLPPMPHSAPAFVDVQITADVAAQVATRLSGACGLGGTDGPTLKNWLLRHGPASAQLCTSLARHTQWRANNLVPWASTRALVSNRGLAIDKFPGVRPIGIGHIERRFEAKCLIRVAGLEATEAAGVDQLSAGLPAGIEGAIHAAHQAWIDQANAPDFGFLCLDARNAFNEVDRTSMLWTVRHLWPSGARFTFNHYKHWSTVILHDSFAANTISLYSATGVTQGCPLAMLIYGLTLLPFIRRLQHEFPTLLHLWYADDGSAAGSFSILKTFFQRVLQLGPAYGYHIQPSKCYIICPTANNDRARTDFAQQTRNSPSLPCPTIHNGHRFLGGFVGEAPPFDTWLAQKLTTWENALTTLARVAPRFPQSAYCCVEKSLQHEWQFIQRVNSCSAAAFQPLENIIATTFLPALFGLPSDTLPPRALTSLPIKHAGLALSNPTTTTDACHSASIAISQEITRALLIPLTPSEQPHLPFSPTEHRQAVIDGRSTARASSTATHDQHLATLKANLPLASQRRIDRQRQTGAWLHAQPCNIERTALSAQEFRDNLSLKFGLTPSHLPSICDGCGGPFSVVHALDCKTGGLVNLRHNEIRDELAQLASLAIPRSSISIEPHLFTAPLATLAPGQPIDQSTTTTTPPPPPHTSTPPDTRGDLAIRNLFERGTTAIIDVRVTDLDSASHRTRDPAAVLLSQEKEKKKKYTPACEARRSSFTPFVVSVDGLFGTEAQQLMTHLATTLSAKQQRPYPPVKARIMVRLSIALAKAMHHCLRAPRNPRHRPRQLPFPRHSQPSTVPLDHFQSILWSP